ncbi:hypothetical protein [Microcoleus sp. MOSTC5]|uniref:hypothetical protein n=1 Tax=Microcoleus sp. MOSTC5 TaxID=3055378 RepID=UPI0040408E10
MSIGVSFTHSEKQWARRLERPAILNRLTTHGDNESRPWRAKYCHFLARWKTTLVGLGILSIVTTHRYGLLLLLPKNLDFSAFFTKYHY